MNNTTNSTGVQSLSATEIAIAIAVLELVAFCGVALNGIALCLTCLTELRRKKISILIGNMAFADFMTSLIFLLAQPYIQINPDRWNSQACTWIGFIQFVAAFETVTFIPYLAINRYIALCHRQLYTKIYTKRGIIIIVLVSWLITILVVTPYKFGGLTGFDIDNLHCCIMYKKDVFWDAYYLTFTFLPIVAADAFALYACFKIYRKLKTQVNAWQTSHNVNSKANRYKSIQWYTILDIVLPVVLLLPYFFTKYLAADRSAFWLRLLMPAMFLSSPLTHGINVLAMLRPYREELRKTLGKMRGKRIASYDMRNRLGPRSMETSNTLKTAGKF